MVFISAMTVPAACSVSCISRVGGYDRCGPDTIAFETKPQITRGRSALPPTWHPRGIDRSGLKIEPNRALINSGVTDWRSRMSTVFISYRRETSAGEARALFSALAAQLGRLRFHGRR